MNTDEIIDILKRHVRRLKFFRGVFPKDKLPEKTSEKFSVIINTDPASKPGEHWVALFVDDKKGFYFDSFGLPPLEPEILLYISKKCSKGCLYNSRQVQSVTSKTCAVYCIIFVCLKERDFDYCQILGLFSKNSKINDSVLQKFLQ